MATDNESPMINGSRPSWSQLSNIIMPYGGPIIRTADITAVSFKVTLEPGKVRGKGPGIRGSTTGQFDTEGSLTILVDGVSRIITEFEKIARRNKCHVLEVPFSLGVSWRKTIGSPKINVSLVGCKFTSLGVDESPGTDASDVEMPIYFPTLSWNGVNLTAVPK